MKYTKEYWEDVSRVVNNIPDIKKIFGKRVLITGGTGMVCSAIIDTVIWLNKECDAGIKLILAGRSLDKINDRFKDVLTKQDFDYISYDATTQQSIDVRADYIIHGASNANPAIFSKEPVETLVGNIIGLDSILKVARNNEGARLLYISSSEVYGNRSDGSNTPYKENDYGFVDILNPRASYPNGKRAAETLCVSYGQEYGVDTVIVRLGHIYGPSITKSDTRASASFTRDVADKHDIVMKSPGAQLRSYCYTLDCASAILTVLLNGATGEAYNISNRDSIASIRDIAEALAQAGKVKVVFENPTDIEKKSYNLMDNSALDSEKLERLGWKAEFLLSEGTEKTIWFY